MDNGASRYQRFLQGEQSAIEEVVEQYNRNLILFINRFVQNLTVAEDLAADTFLELMIKKPKFRQESSFKTYLFAIGRNKSLDFLKRQARLTSQPIEDLPLSDQASEESSTSGQTSIEAALIRDERRLALHRAIESLHAEYRDILHLLYFEDMSYGEAATVLKKSTKQVNNLAYRAKNALRTILKEEDI